jgi:hypothetical protein
MIELRGNIWDLARPEDAIVITTNGFVKSDGACVMGRGIALEAKRRHPGIEYMLGDWIREVGNIPGQLCDNIYIFPVKPCWDTCAADKSNVVSHMRSKFRENDRVPGWACVARTDIITESCRHFLEVFEDFQHNIYMPRPGCGFGELDWNQVKPILETYLVTDRWKVCTF